MLLTGILVKCMEKEGRALGKETAATQILDYLQKRYKPHQDKGNFNSRIRTMQKTFAETMKVMDTKDLSQKENKELFVKKCMSLTMECIRAHIFVAVDYQELVISQSQKVQTALGDEIRKPKEQLYTNGDVMVQKPEKHLQTGENQAERREGLRTTESVEKQNWKQESETDAPAVKTKLQEDLHMDPGDNILAYESQIMGEPAQKEGGMSICSQ